MESIFFLYFYIQTLQIFCISRFSCISFKMLELENISVTPKFSDSITKCSLNMDFAVVWYIKTRMRAGRSQTKVYDDIMKISVVLLSLPYYSFRTAAFPLLISEP